MFLPLMTLVPLVGLGVAPKIPVITQLLQGSLQFLLFWFHEESTCPHLGILYMLKNLLILVWKFPVIDIGRGVPMVQTQVIVLIPTTL